MNPELSWLHLLAAVKPEEVSLRVVLHEIPRREGKCLPELFLGHVESAISEPAKLLDPKFMLSSRQKACVQVFVNSTPFSAKRDVYALSPAQVMNLCVLANDIGLEIRNQGTITLNPEPVCLKGVIQNNNLLFKAVDMHGVELRDPVVIGVERAFLLDSHLKVYLLEPAFLPSEVDAILSATQLNVNFMGREESWRVFSELSKMGVRLECLKSLAKPGSSQIILRTLLSKSGNLRIHLVNELHCDSKVNEVEIRSKGGLEPVFWFEEGLCVDRPNEKEEIARQTLFSLGASPANKHRGFEVIGQKALDFLSKISSEQVLPSWLQVDQDCLPQIHVLPQKPLVLVESAANQRLKIQIKVGEFSFSLDKLFEIAQQGGKAVLLEEDSLLRFSPETIRSLQTLVESLEIKELSQVKEYEFSEIALLLRMLQEDVEIQAEETLYSRLMNLVPESKPEDRHLPSMLKTALRPYQHDALAWMSQMYRAGLGCLLADEMGLGKTLMVLSLLALVKDREGTKPCLVVAPTSVLDVWMAECERHFEGFKTLKWHGTERSFKAEELKNIDIVVTSYALLRRDIEILSQVSFRFLIIDEAQTIKNLRTESWKSARSIQSDHRLALTGTPIENRISDLYSILELVSPSILGDEKSFLKRYGSSERNAELRERVRPMILRRRKEDVASDLPPKIENVLRCEMHPEQKNLYVEVLKSARQELYQMSYNAIPLLAALTRLRQVCCDPRLLPNMDNSMPSAKLELFLDTVEECLSSGRKLIVYSQFVKMQRILIDALRSRGIEDVLWLHGATLNRAEIVSNFQEPTGPRVIVVSLKAGGTGITLTAADTVIYYDPWWNPAVMDQAADRAHRIGQTKTVHLIKLVCENSIEEQILALCEHKRILANDVLLPDQPGQRTLTAEDIRHLLQVEIDREL